MAGFCRRRGIERWTARGRPMSDAKADAKAVFLKPWIARGVRYSAFSTKRVAAIPPLRARVEELLRAGCRQFPGASDIGLITTVDESHGIERPKPSGPTRRLALQAPGADRRGQLRCRLHGRTGKAGPPQRGTEGTQAGMDTRQVVPVSRRSDRAQAIMDHPNIAGVRRRCRPRPVDLTSSWNW